MSGAGLRIAFFGSSLVSAYWNGAATYYRGIIKALHARGHRVTFFEPDAYQRQQHRDLAAPDWASSVVYDPTEAAALACLERAARFDVVIKASGVGVLDDLLEREVARLSGSGRQVVYWDVDAPATLERMQGDLADPLRALVPAFDIVLTYGGGPPVVEAYQALGARDCVPVYNGLDPESHRPVRPESHWQADLSFLGNRLPDREARVEEFFLGAARRLPERAFLLGGSGWEDKPLPANVRYAGHVYTGDHNAFNCTPLAVLNVSREGMARFGFSPATRVFEAAGAGACIISDAWAGMDLFFEPAKEILAAADGEEVASVLAGLDRGRARQIGEMARRRALAHHTYQRRAQLVEAVLTGSGSPGSAAA